MSKSILALIFWSSLLWSLLGSVAAQSGFWAPVIPPPAQYRIECSFDPATGQLQGHETIRFRNSTMRAMDRLALAWSLSSDKTANATANGKPATLLVPPGQKELNGPLLLQLPEAVKPGAELELKMEFRNPHQGALGREHDAALWQSWYPQLWWGFGTADDYEVRIAVPSGLGVATSGVLDSASGIWKAKDVRNFAAWIFDEKQYVADRAQAGDVLVTAVHTAAGAKCAKLLLETAVDVIGFYRQRFGFYPHRSLTIVPGMDYPAGGYPVATAMVAIHGQEQMEKKPEAHFRWITAHEIGHMYWSQYVLAEGEDDLDWLMIGLGIFADREYRRARGIEPPVGDLPVNYVGGRKDGIDTTMDLPDEQQELIEWDFNNIVEHGKSSAMMDALESTIGVGTFDHVYRRALREFHGRRMNWHDFKKLCEEESGEDLGWFFESWVRTNEFTFYRITRQESKQSGSGWRTEVEVSSKGTRLARVPVVVTFADASQQTQHTDRLAAVSELVFESQSPVKEVKLDPSNGLWMLDSEPALSAPELAREVLHMNLTGTGEEALQLMPRAREVHLAHSEAWRHLGLMLYDAKHYPESLECFQKAAETTTDKDYRFFALAWQGLVLDVLGRRDAAVEAYKAAKATGSEQLFRSDQYNLRIDQKWVEERLGTPFKRE